jgi:hypothetical protein
VPYTEKTFDRALDLFEIEVERAAFRFVEEAYAFDWIGYLRAIAFGDDEAILRYTNQMLVILQNLGTRLTIVPARVAAFLASESASFPKSLSQGVVRGDQALSFTLKEIIDTGFDLASGQFVPIYDVFSRAKVFFLRWRVLTRLDVFAFFKLAKSSILAILFAILQIVWAVVVTLAVLVLVHTLNHKWNLQSQQKSLKSLLLSQDSERISRWPRNRIRFRVNVKEGPDKP